MLPLPLLTGPLLVLALLALAWGVGRRLPPCPPPASEGGILAVAAGLGLLQYVFFALGTLGLARPLPLLMVLVLITPASFLGTPNNGGNPSSGSPLLGRGGSSPLLGRALVLTLLCFLPLAAAPVIDHDGQFYHLTASKRWLETGHLDYLPTLTMTQWPMGVEMLFGLFLAAGSDTGAKVLHLALGGLTLVALAQLGERLGRRTAGLRAGVVLVLVARGEFFSAYVDLGVAFQTTAAVLAFVLSEQEKSRRYWLLAGLLSGFAASYKLTGLFLGPMLLLVSGPRAWRDRLLFVMLAAAPVLPYLLRAWWLTGNPVYPSLAWLFPSRDWSPELSSVFHSFHQLYNWGSGHDWSLSVRHAIRLGLIALTLGLGYLGRGLPHRLGLVVAVLLAVSLWLTGPYPRYLIPLLPLATLLLFLRLPPWRVWEPLGYLALLAVALPALRQWPETLPAALGGKEARETYLSRHLSLYPVLTWLNRTTSPDSRFLLVADTAYYSNRPCWLPHPYLQGALRLTRYEDFAADVQKARLTHVIVGRGEQPSPTLFPTENQVRFAQRLAHERGTLIFQNTELEVWRLAPSSP